MLGRAISAVLFLPLLIANLFAIQALPPAFGLHNILLVFSYVHLFLLMQAGGEHLTGFAWLIYAMGDIFDMVSVKFIDSATYTGRP